MAKFLKRILKGVAAVSLGGPTALLAIATRKGIQRRREAKEPKKTVDTLKADMFTTGTSKYYLQELNKKKSKIRVFAEKMKQAKIHFSRGASKEEAISKAGLTMAEVNQPKTNLL